jgi:hypothetical protein
MLKFSYLLSALIISFGLIACSNLRDKDDRKIVTCVSNLGFNLPVSTVELDPLNFQVEDEATFHQSVSYSVFDIYGNSYLHAVYFIKTATDTWLTIFYHDNTPLRIQSPTSGSLVNGVEFYFNQEGRLERTFPENIRSERLILSDDDFEHIFEFRFSTSFNTQLDSPFSTNVLEWSNCTIGE